MLLRSYLSKLNVLSEKEIEIVFSAFVPKKVSKGDHIVAPGALCTQIFFVESGIFRLYYQVEGEEKVMLFFQEGQFATDYFGFLTGSPSIRPVQALEDSVVQSLSKSALEKLYQTIPSWNFVGRILAERAYVFSVIRANKLLHDHPDIRVNDFLTHHADLLQRIPQYLIASYLDMKPETFSRIKKRLISRGEVKKSIHNENKEFDL
jgi:CRP-like cAMP-binding protein